MVTPFAFQTAETAMEAQDVACEYPSVPNMERWKPNGVTTRYRRERKKRRQGTHFLTPNAKRVLWYSWAVAE